MSQATWIMNANEYIDLQEYVIFNQESESTGMKHMKAREMVLEKG